MLEGYNTCKVNLGRFSCSKIVGSISFIEEMTVSGERKVSPRRDDHNSLRLPKGVTCLS